MDCPLTSCWTKNTSWSKWLIVLHATKNGRILYNWVENVRYQETKMASGQNMCAKPHHPITALENWEAIQELIHIFNDVIFPLMKKRRVLHVVGYAF